MIFIIRIICFYKQKLLPEFIVFFFEENMAVALFKERLMSNHYNLIEQLENKYNNYIKKLLQQKKLIIIELQNSLFQQFVHMQKKDDLRNQQKKDDLRNQQISNEVVPDLEPIEQAPSNIDPITEDKAPIFSLKDADPNETIDLEAKSNHSRFKGNKHDKSKLFKCNHCNYETHRKGDLKKHIRIHTAKNRYKCKYCNYTAHRKDMVIRHIGIHLEDKEKPYKCDYCGKGFMLKQDFSKHVKIHTGEKAYKCNYCVKRFKTSWGLNQHTRIHTKAKQYKCNYCNYATHWKGDLNKHIRKHTGEKQFKCNYCNYATHWKGDLNKHIKIHTKERESVCET